MNYNPPGSSVLGTSQAIILKWVAIYLCVCVCVCVCVCARRVRLFATPQTLALQAPLSMGFSRQEYWSELPVPSPFICVLSQNFGWRLRKV